MTLCIQWQVHTTGILLLVLSIQFSNQSCAEVCNPAPDQCNVKQMRVEAEHVPGSCFFVLNTLWTRTLFGNYEAPFRLLIYLSVPMKSVLHPLTQCDLVHALTYPYGSRVEADPSSSCKESKVESWPRFPHIVLLLTSGRTLAGPTQFSSQSCRLVCVLCSISPLMQ